VLAWAFDTYGPDVAIASAFGAEGVVLIDIAARLSSPPPVFVVDTDFLFPETNDLIRRIEARYDVCVERLRPALTTEQQSSLYGPELWSRDPDTCCSVRKIEPLRQKVKQLRAWVTAIRRDQTPDRAHASKVGWDAIFQLVKINPLADWTSEMVWDYIRQNDLPYNALYDRNYPSIGCTHCTSPVNAGDDPRSGRWPGFRKSECGLHPQKSH
jgi:phosphoadenosine phosphosulfate reductase